MELPKSYFLSKRQMIYRIIFLAVRFEVTQILTISARHIGHDVFVCVCFLTHPTQNVCLHPSITAFILSTGEIQIGHSSVVCICFTISTILLFLHFFSIFSIKAGLLAPVDLTLYLRLASSFSSLRFRDASHTSRPSSGTEFNNGSTV